MAKEICISTTPHETRLAILEDDQLAEIYYERENEYTLAGSIYKGRVTRVLPGMQSSFVDVGLERDAFLYVTDFLEEQPDGEEYETSSAGTGRREPAAEGRGERSGEDEGGRASRRGEGRRRERSAAAQAKPAADAPSAAPAEETAFTGESEELTEGTRRWRGRRGRRRGGARSGEQAAPLEAALPDTAAAPFALPEHGAPGGVLGSLHIAELSEDSDSEEPETAERLHLHASAAPNSGERAPAITLPGEALAKYGQKPAPTPAPASSTGRPQQPAAPVNYIPPRPATQVEVGAGWDGGAVLPGETLSRYRNPAPATATPEKEEPVHTAETGQPSEESLAAVSPVSEPGLAVEPEPAQAGTIPAEFHESSDPAETELAEDVTGTSEEYEPEEGASAGQSSPPNLSELRLSQLFGFGETKPEESAPHEPATARETLEAGMEQPEPAASSAHDEPSEPELFDSAVPAAFGERFADEPFADDTREAPIAEPSGLETSGDRIPEMIDQLQGFAPGRGFLEEEVIDEEEYDFDPLHAHAEEQDLEELEEEHLEGTEHREPQFVSGTVSEDAANFEAGEDEIPGVALVEIDEDEEEDEPAQAGEEAPAEGEPRRRAGGDRGRRGNSRLGRGRRGSGGRQSAQTQDLPIISDLLKPGQEIMVQIAKEPIAKKGARITSHIALPGRFLVFMPTVNHVGVSRKIASDEERKRLKRILISEKGESSGGFIVRTAADGASEDELRADLRFLISLWNEIKTRGDAAKAPALIYHDLNLVERILRDQVSSNFSTIWVDTELEYERIVRFLNRFQPALVRRVKLYTKETPLFEHFGITDEISKALKSKVWLKSGGSIVINQTEALVAIDINTGKYVGKTARLEDTIVKTNLDAIPEIVRQIRLRDLGGIIVIDFIDMDERRNRHRVLAALEEAMKADRAPSKVLQFNDFGLVAITRKRVKQSLERTLSVQCEICSGTGMVKSPVTVCNEIYIELRKMQKHLDGKDVMLRVHPEVVKQLKGGSGRWINEYEEMLGKTIIIKSDPSLHPEQFDIH